MGGRPQASPGANPEPMDVSAYDYGAAIGYNTARTPGLGSAIFLHLNIGIATAGCVTLPPGRTAPAAALAEPGPVAANQDGRAIITGPGALCARPGDGW